MNTSYNHRFNHDFTLPSDFLNATISGSSPWSNIFDANSTTDIISYIPMAVNRTHGKTTEVPKAFGYDYYATSRNETEMDEIQIMPSRIYHLLSDSADFYYYKNVVGALPQQYVGATKLGDMRAASILTKGAGEDTAKVWVKKFNNGNIILFRNSTVYLHLAEALNRLGHPDAAFAILKEGINEKLTDSTTTYITPETRELMTIKYPFLSEANKSYFTSSTNYGIHQHGAGITSDGNYPGRSPYQLDTIVGLKLKEIAQTFNVSVGTTKQDSINAMEDILCDEYALEFAFEGTRYPDLCRLARHKNQSGLYGANFGSLWLKRKLEANKPKVDLSDPNNWYLPFK